MKTAGWFAVDKEGLSKLLDRRGRASVILELIQNGWDAPGASNVRVTLKAVNGSTAELLVIDDSPEGFADLSHAFTLFAESTKKADPTLRGRFNLGEKLVLAICKSASIVTRKGAVAFGSDGTRQVTTNSPEQIARNPKIGTTFHAMIEMTKSDIEDAERRVRTLIPPKHVRTTFNGVEIPSRTPIGEFHTSLPTEHADENGVLRRVTLPCIVSIYKVLPDENAMLYELGIPVCETGDTWHVNISQRVPLNMERDGVTPAYLRDVRAAVLEIATYRDLLDAESAGAAWVDDGMTSQRFDADNATSIVRARFGDKAVAFDPSDIEANNRAVASGYTIVHGGSFSRGAWAAIKAGGALIPAGKVTPSPKPYTKDGTPLEDYPTDRWSKAMHAVAWFAAEMAKVVIKRDNLAVRIVDTPHWPFEATYGPDSALVFNLGTLGSRWFDTPVFDPVPMLDLLIHEFGHEHEGNHLSEAYYKALTRIGAKTAVWLASDPRVLSTLAAKYR